ncbi:hypothetical protein PENSPDRAFT_757181 [Peniophora sp. CONT]|nr:hypothetical protein PENSPDRAFT_757181 [Peniophora sp. CONT]
MGMVTEKTSSIAQDLAAELLDAIFLLVAVDAMDFGERIAPPCMRLSHVCASWRTVALARQELWATFLPRKSPKWTEICLARCPSIPLTVTIDQRNHNYPSARKGAALVLSRSPRVRSISIKPALHANREGYLSLTQSFMGDLDNCLLESLTKPHDLLEELKLDFGIEVGLDHDDWIAAKLSENIFSSQNPPRLHRVTLVRCRLPATPLPQLFTQSVRSLILGNTPAWSDVDSMIQCLRGMPMLERLTYKYWLDEPKFDCRVSRSHQPRCVHLPHLMNFHLGGFWLQNLSVFNYLSIPINCTVHLSAQGWDDRYIEGISPNTVDEIVAMSGETLKRHFTPATSCGTFFARVEILDWAVVAQTQNTSRNKTIHEDAALPTTIQLEFPRITHSRILAAAYRLYLSQPVMTQANRLFFTGKAWKFCPEVFDQYTAVRRLSLAKSEDADALASALRLKGASLFPGLRRVVIARHFHNPRLYELQPLAVYLRDTREVGGSFECLEISHCKSIPKDAADRITDTLGSDRVA